MGFVRSGLLILYFLAHLLPFVIVIYFGINQNEVLEKRKCNHRKIAALLIGCIVNVVCIVGMYRIFYGDWQLANYIMKIWELNLYSQDMQYFLYSVAVEVVISTICGMLLRFWVCNYYSHTKMYEFKALLCVATAFLLFMLGLGTENYYQSKIILNEICSDNELYAMDESKAFEDYIELYNTGIFPCDTTGLYLSDDLYDLQKISLKGQQILANDYLVVSCIDAGNSFSINNKGECIYLSNAEGEILEQIEVTELEENTAYIRITETEWQVGNGTPGMANDSVLYNSVEMPILSHNSGFYDAAFELEITSDEDTIIYYTLDGSTPDEGSYIYEGPISVYDRSQEANVWRSKQNVVRKWQEYDPDETPVDKAFVIRTMAMDNEGNKSDVVTATYFVGVDGYENEDVISLVVDPEKLYDDETGIYVSGKEYDEWYLNGEEGEQPTPNFRQKGRDWEREAVFELFEDSESVFQQNVGIRIQGANAREDAWKRFSIYARKEYSNSKFFVKSLFGTEVQSHSVVLRDTVADAICQSLMEDRGIAYQRYRRVYLFLNGEYWYSTYLREKYDNEYFENYYEIDEDNLIVIEGNAVSSGLETDMVQFQELYRYIQESDFTDDTAYKKLGEMLDIQNYIDFLAANIYCTNMDISLETTKNVVMWKSRENEDREYADGRWRFALYDMDSMHWNSTSYYEVENRAEIDAFSQKPQYADLAYNQGVIYSSLRKNDDFCKQFVLTCMDLMNTSFSIENVREKLVYFEKNTDWSNSFFEKRPAYMKEYLAKEFELTGSVETVTLYNENEEEGTITINTITPAMKNGNWTGEYFTDYSITVTANPAKGYEFVEWSGSVVSDEMTIEVPVTVGGVELKAEFREVK